MRILFHPRGAPEVLKTEHFDTVDEARAFVAKYIADSPEPPVFYRLIRQDGSRDLLLRRIRIRPGSEVYEQKLVSAEIEDDV